MLCLTQKRQHDRQRGDIPTLISVSLRRDLKVLIELQTEFTVAGLQRNDRQFRLFRQSGTSKVSESHEVSDEEIKGLLKRPFSKTSSRYGPLDASEWKSLIEDRVQEIIG